MENGGTYALKQEAFTMSLLFDYYVGLLTEKQRSYFDLYYNQDLSLSEIAEQEGISRQGVHDTISRAEAILRDAERSIGCIARERTLQAAFSRIQTAAQSLLQHQDPSVRQNGQAILAALSSAKE